MRRILGLLAVVVVLIGASGCEPAPTVTATPSTLKPGCDTVTTVTGVGTPATKVRNIVIEQSGNDGKWYKWVWFPDNSGPKGELRASTKPDGSYTVTYGHPVAGSAVIRLRVRGMLHVTDKDGPVSKSWYVTPPTGC